MPLLTELKNLVKSGFDNDAAPTALRAAGKMPGATIIFKNRIVIPTVGIRITETYVLMGA